MTFNGKVEMWAGEQRRNGEVTMRKFLKTLWADESGAAAAEYALLLALIAVGIATAAGLLGGVIQESIEDACTEIATAESITGSCT